MQKFQRGTAQPVLTKGLVTVYCPAPSTGVAIAADRIAVTKKEKIL
jgi:hypothetical protein